ncbi:MAG: hypothetical protein QW275_01080 [Candidatus Anstonellaceae archaeon]
MKAVSLAAAISFIFLLFLAFGCAQTEAPAQVEDALGNQVVIEQEKPPAQPLEQPTDKNPCQSGNVLQKDECFLALARSKSDPELCKHIYSIDRKDDCYFGFSSSGLQICNRITNAERKSDCITENALMRKDPGMCQIIANNEARAKCLEKVVSPCMRILEEEKRELCLALEKNDYALCKSERCFEGYAKEKGIVEPCTRITTLAEKFKCLALAEKSTAACKLADQEAVRDKCLEEAAKELDDLKACDFATPGSQYANRCYLYFAVKNNEPDLCRKVLQEREKDACYSSFAAQTANSSACSKVIESLNRISCYRNSAIQNRKPSLCNGLENSAWMRDCYAASILYVDAGPVPSDCALVAESSWKDKCYLRAAIKSSNGSYCDYIQAVPDKIDCDELFPR